LWQGFGLENARLGGAYSDNAKRPHQNSHSGSHRARWPEVPLVAAVAKANAVAAVKQVVPTNYVAVLSERRLTLTRKLEVLRRGEVRRIKL
jgi:hypothetical protein